MPEGNGVVQTELVTAAQRGDAEAFAALERLSSDRLYAVAVRVTRDHHLAEDALQQALIATWKELPRLRDPDRFEAWTYRLILRFAVQEARARRPQGQRIFALSERESSPDSTSAGVAIRDQLERGFRRLSPEQRAVMVLHFYAGLSLAEIAEILGIPLGTAGSRLHYAKRAMRAALAADDRVEERAG